MSTGAATAHVGVDAEQCDAAVDDVHRGATRVTTTDAFGAILHGEAIALDATKGEFDALFAVTDVIAIDAMHALEDKGLSVPDDVAVVGFDDILLAAHVSPPLTTVRQDIRLAAEGLVEGIVGLIEGEPVESSVMAPRLVVRASCGAP